MRRILLLFAASPGRFQGSRDNDGFGYTQCPDVCPATMGNMRELMAKLGPEAERMAQDIKRLLAGE